MQGAIIAPIVGFIALVLQLFFGIDLTADQINVVTDGFVAITLAGATIYGTFKAYQKKDDEVE